METAKVITQINVGDVLEVPATDPAADPDIKAWAGRMGHGAISAEKTPEGHLRILVRRLK